MVDSRVTPHCFIYCDLWPSFVLLLTASIMNHSHLSFLQSSYLYIHMRYGLVLIIEMYSFGRMFNFNRLQNNNNKKKNACCLSRRQTQRMWSLKDLLMPPFLDQDVLNSFRCSRFMQSEMSPLGDTCTYLNSLNGSEKWSTDRHCTFGILQTQ